VPVQNFKMKQHEDLTWTVLVDGVDISSKIRGVSFQLGNAPNRLVPTVIIDYFCLGQMTIEGEADIVHVCPKGGRGKQA